MAEKGFLRRVFSGAAPVPEAKEPSPKRSWLERLKGGLSRSSDALTASLGDVFLKRTIDPAALDEFEDALIKADLGLDVASGAMARIRAAKFREITVGEVKAIIADEIERVVAPVAKPLELDPALKPHVILVVGVNGTGKTTTIGKLAAKFRAAGLKVVLAAGDTFRAAAIDQLRIWGERTGATVIAREPGSDSAGLAFDALKQAKENSGAEVLLIDTAGRLQNKEELMAELEKIVRVIRKIDPTAPHTVLLTLDATTGQNALNQVEIFGKRAGVTGLVMTKLDGTARGGILVAVAARYRMPVHFIGVGEGVDDLESFSATDFAKALAGL